MLTDREGRTEEYWPDGSRGSTDRGSEVRTKTIRGSIFPVRLQQARLVSSYGTRALHASCRFS